MLLIVDLKMNETLMERNNALVGALVADAASMGMHWLYDQEQIKLIESTGSILFRQPEASVYENKRGAFVHGVRRAGQLSHYGESARIVGELALQRTYSANEHQKAFMAAFGPCGSFHGYADRPTKALIARIVIDGDNLSGVSGMDDDQLPALCVVPGLFAGESSLLQTIDAAKVISTNKVVLSATEALRSVLSKLADGSDLKTALANTAAGVDGEMGENMREALNKPNYAPLETAQEFGLACYVRHAMPLSWYLLNHATGFESVVLDNIRCGGDCCGRAMVIGSIAGLVFGVPENMRKKTSLTAPIGLG